MVLRSAAYGGGKSDIKMPEMWRSISLADCRIFLRFAGTRETFYMDRVVREVRKG